MRRQAQAVGASNPSWSGGSKVGTALRARPGPPRFVSVASWQIPPAPVRIVQPEQVQPPVVHQLPHRGVRSDDAVDRFLRRLDEDREPQQRVAPVVAVGREETNAATCPAWP